MIKQHIVRIIWIINSSTKITSIAINAPSPSIENISVKAPTKMPATNVINAIINATTGLEQTSLPLQ